MDWLKTRAKEGPGKGQWDERVWKESLWVGTLYQSGAGATGPDSFLAVGRERNFDHLVPSQFLLTEDPQQKPVTSDTLVTSEETLRIPSPAPSSDSLTLIPKET